MAGTSYHTDEPSRTIQAMLEAACAVRCSDTTGFYKDLPHWATTGSIRICPIVFKLASPMPGCLPFPCARFAFDTGCAAPILVPARPAKLRSAQKQNGFVSHQTKKNVLKGTDDRDRRVRLDDTRQPDRYRMDREDDAA